MPLFQGKKGMEQISAKLAKARAEIGEGSEMLNDLLYMERLIGQGMKLAERVLRDSKDPVSKHEAQKYMFLYRGDDAVKDL